MKPKYAVMPRHIISHKDGNRRYVGPWKLIDLYGVDHRECVIFAPNQQWTPSAYRVERQRIKGLIKLRPREDGNYTLPT